MPRSSVLTNVNAAGYRSASIFVDPIQERTTYPMTRMKTVDLLEPAIACCAPLAAAGLTDEEAEGTARLFKALGDPARVRILNLLLYSDDPVCVCDFMPATGLAQPTVS